MNYLAALGVPLIWAFTIISARVVVGTVDPLWGNAFRFLTMGLVGLACIALAARPQGASKWQRTWRDYLLPALAAFLLYCCLLATTIAVARTTVAKTVFYATLYAFFIPMIKAGFMRVRYRASLLPLLALAMLGSGFMANFSLDHFNDGDAFAVGGAVFYALYVILIERITHDWDSAQLVNVQSVVMGVISLAAALCWGGPLAWPGNLNFNAQGVIFAAAFAAWVGLTYAAYWLQARVQRNVSAHVLGLLMTLDAPLGCVLGYIFFAEAVPPSTMIGGALVTCAALLAPWLAREKVPLATKTR
jgi:drug/metabolite transporter (DMT)-like permease